MAFLTETQNRPSIFDAAASKVADLKVAYANYRIFTATVAELSALNMRDLADLGISRGDINRIAREAAYGV